VSLVEGDRQQLEAHRGPPLENAEQLQQGVRVLAPRHTHHDPVAPGDEAEVGDGPAHVAEQALLQA
jgi:hypothetical protein